MLLDRRCHPRAPWDHGCLGLSLLFKLTISMVTSNKRRRYDRWLAALATPKGGRHKDLGRYVPQDHGRAFIQPIRGRPVERCERCQVVPKGLTARRSG